MNIQLEIGYKGNRGYLHGSDFFNALMEVAPAVGDDRSAFVQQLIFRRFARNGCDVTTERPNDTASVAGQVSFWLPKHEASVAAWLVETERAVKQRCPFDEAVLLSTASLNVAARSNCLPERSIYTPIEVLIALTKQLNYSVCPLEKGQWVFGQLDLAGPMPADYRRMEIRMKNLLAGRFSINEVYVDDRPIGAMRFIVGAP